MDVEQAEGQVSGGQGQGSVTPVNTNTSAVLPPATGAGGSGQERTDTVEENPDTNTNDEAPPVHNYSTEICKAYEYTTMPEQTENEEHVIFFSAKSNFGVL